jgi:prepilin-type N-terminal cleavage/methylation domain-containing protein
MKRKLGFACDSRGFTLIELMMVVVIVGLLTALAIPRFTAAVSKAKQQSEVKALLKQIYTMQRVYWQEQDTYGCNGLTASGSSPDGFVTIGVQIMAHARYTYSMVADSSAFTCTATANLDGDVTIDTWTIDEDGTMTNTINDVTS